MLKDFLAQNNDDLGATKALLADNTKTYSRDTAVKFRALGLTNTENFKVIKDQETSIKKLGEILELQNLKKSIFMKLDFKIEIIDLQSLIEYCESHGLCFGLSKLYKGAIPDTCVSTLMDFDTAKFSNWFVAITPRDNNCYQTAFKTIFASKTTMDAQIYVVASPKHFNFKGFINKGEVIECSIFPKYKYTGIDSDSLLFCTPVRLTSERVAMVILNYDS